MVLAGVALAFLWMDHSRRDDEARRRYETAVAKLDTVYLTDTLRLTQWRTKYTALHDTLKISDTVWVKSFIVAADSTITACTKAVMTCEQRDLLRKVRIAELERGDRLFGIKLPSRTVMLGIGVLGGFILAK
jgi:hypothetical protein